MLGIAKNMQRIKYINATLNIVLFIVTIIIIFIILEISLKIFYPQPVNPTFLPVNERDAFAEYDPLLGWRLKSNTEGYFFSSEYKIYIKNNAQGLRMEYNVPSKKSSYRIAFLGDSFIWGSGVNDKERISDLIEKDLENVEVLNFGVSGYGTDQEYLQLKNKVLNFNPNMVIITFYVNDLEDAGNSIRYNYPKPLFLIDDNHLLKLTNVPVPKKTESKQTKYSLISRINFYLSHNSHAFVFFKPLLIKTKSLINPSKTTSMYGNSDILLIKKNYSLEYESYEKLNKRLYCEMSKLLKENNITFIVINIPAKSYISKELLDKRLDLLNIKQYEIDINKPSRILLNTSKECGFYFLDLYPEFKDYKNKDRLYYKYDDHWTYEGHKYSEEILLNYIKEKGLIK